MLRWSVLPALGILMVYNAAWAEGLPNPTTAAVAAITDLLAKTQRESAMQQAELAGLKAQVALEHQYWDRYFAPAPLAEVK